MEPHKQRLWLKLKQQKPENPLGATNKQAGMRTMTLKGSHLIPSSGMWSAGRATEHTADSTGQMSRFETKVLTQPGNLMELTRPSGNWINRLRARQKKIEIS